MIRFIGLSILLIMAFCRPVLAQESVSVRTGDHAGYSRIVFDWSKTVGYTIHRVSADTLEIAFDRPAILDMAGLDMTGAASDLRRISDEGQSLKVRLKIPAGREYRHFTVAKRVVVDVIASGGEKTASVSESTPAPAASDSHEKTVSKKTKKHTAITAATAKEIEQKIDHPAVKVDRLTPLELAKPALEPHVITLSMTESVAVAAFVRFGQLWIVLDRTDVTVPPQVTGPNPDFLPPFTRYELKGGVAFRTELPDGAAASDLHLYGEGGGLIWRIVLTPYSRDVDPVVPARVFLRNKLVRGGTASWPFRGATKILDLPDPATGDILKVVTVEASDQFAGPVRDFVDFRALDSLIGLAIQAKVDDLDVSMTPNGIEVTRSGGLAMSRGKDVSRHLMRREVAESQIEELIPGEEEDIRRIFDFDRWLMGGIQALGDNQQILLANMAGKDKNGQVQDLLTLAKMDIANDRGQEAIGFLRYAAQEFPAIAEGAEYMALRGAAYALSGKYELAFRDLNMPVLKDYSELNYWRAYALAWLEDWQQARVVMPKDYSVLIGYPEALLAKIGLKLAEVSLRGADVEKAEAVLAVLQKNRSALKSGTIAGIDYLKGEAHRQSEEYDMAKNWWEPLSTGKDDLYRAKAGLALVMLQMQIGEITREKAIDRLEGLRYAWRGDELEARINAVLGQFYLDQGRHMKGFTILRDAAGMSPDSDIGRQITSDMAARFKKLLMEDDDLSPLDAVSVYEEFRELTPTGDAGNKLVQKLAERLVEADLLGRAAAILQHQVDYRIEGLEKARVALRMAGIYLLNNNPRLAIKGLNKAKKIYARQDDDLSRKKLREIELLRARALSQLNHTEEAIELLNGFDPDPDVNRLRADIAWKAGLWEDAAEALQDLILDEELNLKRPLSQDQADIILNRAVALNLSSNRVALANMRKRYYGAMKKTARARLFDVVTRPRKNSMLADREAIAAIVSEVDIFKDFLETYRNAEDIGN